MEKYLKITLFNGDELEINNPTYRGDILSSEDFISVQPMNIPSGQLFYMDYMYSHKITLFSGLEIDLNKIKIITR